MNVKQAERLVVAFESMAKSIKAIANIQKKRFDHECPTITTEYTGDAEIFKAGETSEGESATGRFERLFREQTGQK